MENFSFTRRTIDKLQRLSIDGPKALYVAAMNEYLMRLGRIIWDDARALCWVRYPVSKDAETLQVAVWMMPIASRFDPLSETEENSTA